MNENVLISVVVPIYNVEKFLPKCIESLLAQTHKELEIILVNDGSTDSSLQICEEYAQKDTRVKIIHKKNEGVSIARNTGIDIAQGKYIGFADSDDWADENMFETLLSNIEKEQADIAVCGYYLDYENGKSKIHSAGRKIISQNIEEHLQNFLNGSLPVPSWANLYKKELFEKIRFQADEAKHEDLKIAFPLWFSSKKIIIAGKPLYHYIQHPNMYMQQPFSKKRMENVYAIQSWLTECGKQNEKTEQLIFTAITRYSWYTLVYVRCKFTEENIKYCEELIGYIRKYKKYLYLENKIDSFFIWLIAWKALPYKFVLRVRESLRKMGGR